jgi:hypothetical protein
MPGMVKTVINGIIFILLYWNEEFEVNRFKHWSYIKDLVNSNKRMVVCGDLNK